MVLYGYSIVWVHENQQSDPRILACYRDGVFPFLPSSSTRSHLYSFIFSVQHQSAFNLLSVEMLPQIARSGSKKILGISLVLVVLVTFGILSVISTEHAKPEILPVISPEHAKSDGSPFPRKIWQIFFNPRDSTFQYPHSTNLDILHDTRSWIGLNPGYQYKLMGIGLDSGDSYVIKHFSHDKSIIDTYFALRNPGLKTDLLRYLILWIEGGIYSDLDTWTFKPVDAWVPEHMIGQVGAIVGIEWDRMDGKPWPAFDNGPSDMTHDVQFCQWTLAGAAGHPLFKNAAITSVERIAALAAARQESITDLNPTRHVRQGITTSFFCPVTFPLVVDLDRFDETNTEQEVVTTTGPSAWSDVVFEYLHKVDLNFTEPRELSGLTEPRLVGDVLVLTIDGFGMGQPHSHSTSDGSTPDAALVKHGFAGTWAKERPH